MDPMTKMYISILAIVLMFVCNFLIIYARKQANKVLSLLLKIISFVMLIAVLLMILVVLLF